MSNLLVLHWGLVNESLTFGSAGVGKLLNFPQTKILLARQGESIPFTFARDTTLSDDHIVSNWTLTIFVKKYPSDAAIIDREIQPTGTNSDIWQGFLTKTETAALSTGLYRLIGKLINNVNDEEQQIPLRFNISNAWA